MSKYPVITEIAVQKSKSNIVMPKVLFMKLLYEYRNLKSPNRFFMLTHILSKNRFLFLEALEIKEGNGLLPKCMQ